MVFCSLAMSFALMIVVMSYLVWDRWRIASSVHQRLALATRELHALQGRTPPLTVELAAKLEAELTSTLVEWEDVEAFVEDGISGDPTISPERVQRADVFFEVASFVERMRAQAERCGIELKPQEQFGFGDYASASPDIAGSAAILRERMAVEVVLKALFEAHPRELVAVQREGRVTGGNGSSHRQPPNSVSARADYFEWDLRGSVRVPESINTLAFRVVFIGQTMALRMFLNALGSHELPLLVREVEVAPMPGSASARRGRVDFGQTTALIPQLFSRFTVTVELLQIINKTGAED
jgi:hypothetical protein